MFYDATPDIVQTAMDEFGERTRRQYRLFDYVGAPDATEVIVMMGSGSTTAEETVLELNKQGAKVGVVKVRLFRPFSTQGLIAALPSTLKTVVVLDRTKEPGATGEPLYQDVLVSVVEETQAGRAGWSSAPKVIGGRYGLSSKEFTPAMVAGIFQEAQKNEP